MAFPYSLIPLELMGFNRKVSYGFPEKISRSGTSFGTLFRIGGVLIE